MTKPSMLKTALLAAMAALTTGDSVSPAQEISLVLEPFENNVSGLLDFSSTSILTLHNFSDDSLFGSASLITLFNETTMNETIVSFGWDLLAEEKEMEMDYLYNCWGASRLSIWYKLTIPASNREVISDTNLKIALGASPSETCYTNPDTTTLNRCMDWYETGSVHLDPSSDWQQLSFAFDDTVWSGLSEDGPLVVTNLDRLVAWKIEVTDSSNVPSSLQLDQLSCVGDGISMLGGILRPSAAVATESLPNRDWLVIHFNSEKSEEETIMEVKEDGLHWDVSLKYCRLPFADGHDDVFSPAFCTSIWSREWRNGVVSKLSCTKLRLTPSITFQEQTQLLFHTLLTRRPQWRTRFICA